MHDHFDIAVCGAGPIGLALAALLAKQGVPAARIALIDAKSVEQSARDPRSIALSYGSRQILESLHAWPAAATPIHQIHVSRRGHFGRTLIDRNEYALPALGYVTRYGALVSALASSLESQSTAERNAQVAQIRPATVIGIEENPDHVAIRFVDRASIHASIVVQAEGGLFNEQAQKATHRDYDQTAIVAHVKVTVPILHRAFERFTDEGPLALLPQDDGYALVWCARPSTAGRLLALSDSQFLSALSATFGNRLGSFSSITPRNAFTLGLNAQPVLTARTVSIGNAAQTLHPVAGQGLNLGLRDAVVLARLLAQHTAPDALKDFIKLRKADRGATIHLTDFMARVFAAAPTGSLSQAALGLSLGLVDGIKPAKRLLAEQMMFGRRV